MPIATPPTFTVVPALPDKSDQSTFRPRWMALLAYIKNIIPVEWPAAMANVFANATEAFSSATAANTSATQASQAASGAALSAAAAATNAGAAPWVSGTTYALGARVYDAVNGRIYRRSVAGAGTVAPSADAANWLPVQADLVTVVVTSATITAVAGYRYVLVASAATAVTLPATPLEGDVVAVIAQNNRTDNVVLRNASLLMVDRATGLGLAEDMSYDTPGAPLNFKFINGIWRLI